jgi:hypothetical protein
VTRLGGGLDFLLYGPQGGAEQGRLTALFPAGRSLAPHPTGSGWQGTVHEQGSSPPITLRTWDAAGRVLTDDTTHQAQDTAPTVDGGSVTVVTDLDASGRPGTARLQWRDASGAVQREVSVERALGLAIQNWATRHVLVIARDVQPSTRPWAFRWFGDDGAPLTAWTDIPGTPILRSQPGNPALKLLVDGRVVLHDGTVWARLFTDGQTTTAEAPGWMTSRREQWLYTIRGGRGYAATTASRPGFEVLTRDGESCGTFTPPAPTAPAGETWTGGGMSFIGEDGTVLERLQRSGGALDNSNHCGFRAWPGLLR